MSDVVWRPTADVVEHANATRLMRRAGAADHRELVARSSDDPAWFWPLAIDDMGLEFSAPWTAVFDDSRGPEWTTWFPGGKVSIARNCVHRWAERTPDTLAAVGLAEDGTRSALTFAELSHEVTRLAEALVRLGVEPGDRVALFLPMSTEAAIASHACAHVGAIQVPIFSGFAAPAVAQRLRSSEAQVVITARELDAARQAHADAGDPRGGAPRGAVRRARDRRRRGTTSSPTAPASCPRSRSTPRRRTS